jgi:hypothetical protein
MANEITATASLAVSKNGASIGNSVGATVTLSGNAFFSNVQAIGTAAEAVDVQDLGSANYALFKNLDATNYVELALDSGVSTAVFAKILAGGVALVPLKTTTIYAKANTAACNLLVSAVEL